MVTPKPRKRRRWLWLGLLPVLALGGFFAVRTLLQPERLSAFLLRQAADATGLEITLAEPAEVGFWPDLHLELSGITAAIPGKPAAPLLRAERIDAVLPWSALRAETLQLRSLRLYAPVLDVAVLKQWLSSREEAGPPRALRLPQLDAALAVEQGRILDKDWTIAALNLALPSLRDGESTVLTLDGILERAGHVALPFDLRIALTPRQAGDELRLEAMTLSAHDAGMDAPWLQLGGSLTLRHPQHLAFKFDGALPQWPATWPSLPLPATPDKGEVSLSFDYSGTPNLQGALAVRVARGDESLDGSLQLGDLSAWVDDPDARSLPPLRGALEAPRLQFGGIDLRGVSVRIDDDAPAATANSSGGSDAKP